MLFEMTVLHMCSGILDSGLLLGKAVFRLGPFPVPGYWDGQCFITAVLTRYIYLFNFQQGYPVP